MSLLQWSQWYIVVAFIIAISILHIEHLPAFMAAMSQWVQAWTVLLLPILVLVDCAKTDVKASNMMMIRLNLFAINITFLLAWQAPLGSVASFTIMQNSVP